MGIYLVGWWYVGSNMLYGVLQWESTAVLAVLLVLTVLTVFSDTWHYPLANSTWCLGLNNLTEWFIRYFGHGEWWRLTDGDQKAISLPPPPDSSPSCQWCQGQPSGQLQARLGMGHGQAMWPALLSLLVCFPACLSCSELEQSSLGGWAVASTH